MGKASKKKRNLTGTVSSGKSRQIEPLSQTINAETGLLHKPVFHILLIITLGLLAYSNTFHSSFQFDDEPNIVENPIIKNLHFFIEPSEVINFKGYIKYKPFILRYFGYLTFALNYKLHGLNVTGYHIFNLSIHIINAVLVYWFVLLTFKTPFFSQIAQSSYPPFVKVGQGRILIALFSALLFVSHPIQTQAVTYIVQRFTSLATMFYLLSLVMYIKWRLANQKAEIRRQEAEDRNKTKNPGSGILKLKPVFYYLSSLTSAVLAMKTKEIAFTLPIIIVLYEFMFFDGKIKRRILYLIPLLLTMLIIPLSLIGTDKPIGDLIRDVSEATRVETTMPRLPYLFTQFRVIVTYIRLLFFPINQNLDYDYPRYHSLFEAEVFLSFLFLLSILGLGFYLFYRYRHSDTHIRLITFGILWFFITLSVESSIIPILDVIFEHRAYLPSAGIFIAAVSTISIAMEKLKHRGERIGVSIASVICVIIFVLAGVTYARNMFWKDALSLWGDTVSKSPKNARAHGNLGLAYGSNGLIDDALKHYQIAVELNPVYLQAHYNLGNSYASKGLIDKAIEQYQIAVKLEPSYLAAYINLGNAYAVKGLIDKAIEQYQTVIKLNPDSLEAHNNLGILYLKKRDKEKARKEFETVLQINPQHDGAKKYLNSILQGKTPL